ncbi:MAG: hypothetical protein H6841_10525 [Planctomycetes bacterium]|nr:hypothetical protein [Planctomycetota bacterium]
MSELHVTLIPCRSVRVRAGLMYVSGISNIIWSDETLPCVVPKAAVFIRLTGKQVGGEYTLTPHSPGGDEMRSETRRIAPFDIAGISEDWFDLTWLALPQTGRYTLKLEIGGTEAGSCPLVVL